MAENTILDAKAGDPVNNSVAADKRYMITRDSLPNKVSERDADWWEQNRDKVFSDYDDVHAFEVSPYDANDVKETDQYIITLSDQPGVSMRDGKWWAENSERMYKDYPNAQVKRVRYIDYWYDKAMRDKENIESLEDEIASLREQQSSYQRWSPEYNEYERKIAQKQTDLISVEDSYNKNPRVVEAEKRYQEQYRALQEEYKENYIANLFSQIEEWKNEDVAKGRSYSTLSESQGEEIAMHTSRMAAMGQRTNGVEESRLQKSVSESNARIGRTRDYVSAEAVLEWAVEHRNNYRSVWQGLAQGLEELLSGHLAQVETTTEAAFRKLDKKYGDPSFLTNEDIERELEPNEKAAIYAYFQFLASDEEVQEKASSAYKGGKQFADMIPFLIEFALLKAPAEALAERATSKMALKLGTWALAKSGFKGIARQMTAKAIVGTVDAAVAGAVMTATSPLVVSSVRDTIQAGGGPTEVLKTIGNEYIERFTEFAGDGLAKMLGVVGEGFKTTTVGSKIANSAFGKGWSTFFNSKGMQVIGNFGIQSFPIEIFEELEAAAIREMLALDSKALDQFFDEDNFMTMLISFAPMQLIGVASSATAMGVAKHDLGSTREIMYKELSANYDNKIIDNAANVAMSAKTPKEVEDAMRPLLKQMIEDGASFKQIKSMLNYFKAVATYKTFVSVSEERDRSLIDAKYTEIEDNVGDFWVKMAEDIEGVRQVRVAQLNDGRTVFVTSAANEQGEFTIKDAATGKIGYAKESDIAETQDENGNTIRLDNTMNIDDFLNAEVMSERQNAEVKRMTEERQAQIDAMKQRLAENKQINLGTEEAPQIVVAKSMTNNGVQVVDESGNSAVLSWEQVGNVIGTPLDVKTDAQIVEQEIADLLSKQAERKTLLAQGRIITPAQADAAVSEAEESIAAANPVHIPTNPDGSVDENAFWNANPQGWAEWNDEQNNDGGVDSYEQITAAKAELTARLAEIQKLQATSNPANRRQAKAEAQHIAARLAEIEALEKQYAEKLQTPGQKRAAVEQAIRDRAEQWHGLTGVKIVVVENASEIKNADVAQAMANGSTVMAWTTGNEAYVYLPNIDSVEMFDQKFAHEVVAHIGIKELLGKKGYEAFCEKVWTVMSPAAQRHFLAYPGVKGNPILAADEYIAHIAEQMGSGVANMEEQSVWQKIVQFFKEMLNSILGVYAQELTEQEILNNIKLSFANLVEKQGVAQEAADQTRLSAREEIDALASELTPEEMAAVINNDLQAAQEAYAKLSASAPVVEPGESSKAFIERKRAYAEQLAAAKAEMEAKQAIVDEAARMAEEQQPEEAAAPVEEAAPRSLEPTIVETENGEAMAETDGNGSVRFSVLTYEQGGREYLVNWLAGEKYMDQSEKDFIVATLDQQYNLAKQLGKDFPVFGAWSSAEVDVDAEGNPIMSVIKANGDYSMNLDFSLICKKRRPLNALLDVMIADRMLDMRTLNEGEIAKINKVIQRHGFEVACALCFVDSKRYRVVKVAADFADLYNDLVQSLIPAGSDIVATEYNYAGYEYINERNAEKTGRMLDSVSDVELDWTKVDEVLKGVKTPKTVEQKVAKMLRDNPEFRKLANATDFVTNLGFESVKRNNPELLKVYNAKKGTGGPKASFGDVQYLNDILKSKSFTPEKAYSVGGVRVQSFSDYMGHMFFDYMQMMAELAAKGLPAHAYTKEEAFARIFGMTGMKINMSLVPAVKADGVAPGLDAEGNYAWAVPYTDEQGNEIQGQTFPPEVAFEMQQDPRYSGNVGVIAVGVSDEHILKMLGDENIHFIIPYHKSSISGIVAKETNIDQFKDYTLTQNTKLAPTEENNSLSPKQKKKILEQKAFDFYKSLGRTHDPKATAQEYLDHCRNNGLVPKFEQFAKHENYYKLLVDFNTYDFVTGEYAPQGPVKMNFPEELEALVKASVASNEVLESDLKDKVGKMAEDVKAELGETRFSANTENKSISLQNNGNNEQNEQETIGPDTNVGWEANSSGVARNTAGIVERTRDRSDIRVFEQGLESSHGAHSHDSERARRDAESERLVDIAKKNNLYIPLKDTDSLGEKVQKRTGESVVYIDEETGRVFKVKDPYAKSAMKAGVEPEDAIYEHIVHNLVFPEAPYKFVGISDKFGDVRIVLSQDYLPSVASPTKAQIAEALASKGLLPENAYSFGNDLISVTDVEGDNVLLGEDGTVYFIDPIIRFKKPVQEVIESLSAEDNVRFSARTDEQRTALFDNAKQHYGLTNNFNAAGYMLPDGSLLDFSEANDGGDPNQRSLDHRDIEGIIMDEGKEYDSRWMYIADFMNEGAIRLLPEHAGINIMQAPTSEQRKRLFDFIYKYNGEVILEIADERLNNIAYVEYDRRTSPARVLRDIDNYFNNAVIPQQETRFSASNQNQEIFVSNAAKAVEGIKMAKATPEQWLNMLEKNGGLKAAEDKWMGLSDWLKASDKKTLTKDEVLQFINENKIIIEEQHYNDVPLEDRENATFENLKEKKGEEFTNRLIGEAFIYEEGARGPYLSVNDPIEATSLYYEETGDEIPLSEEGLLENEDYDKLVKWAESVIRDASEVAGARQIQDIRLGYTTSGLINNHEIALTVPTVEPWNETNLIHFGDAGNGRAVAWVRFGETKVYAQTKEGEEYKAFVDNMLQRYHIDEEVELNRFGTIVVPQELLDALTDEQMNKLQRLKAASMSASDKTERSVLVIDEIQSNRHQEGREKGYATSKEDVAKATEAFQSFNRAMKEKYGESVFPSKWSEEDQAEFDRLRDEHSRVSKSYNKGIPAAPFEKNWHELAMKRMLRYAAENGYDFIAWTKGDQQAKRYDLSRDVKKISTSKANKDGERIINIYYRDEYNDFKNLVVDKDGKVFYGDFFGSNLADVVGKEMALQIMNAEDATEFSGEGLMIGGEGMRGFYDKMLPSFMNKYGKKWGIKVEDINLPNLGKSGYTMHSVPVTEEMKSSVMEGQTMFSAIAPHQSSIDEVDQMFADWNRDPFVGELYAKVSDLAHKMNLKIKFVEPWSDAGGANILDKVKYNVDYFNSNDYAQTKAGVLLHELIHAVTVYAVVAKNSPILTQGMKDAVMQIEAIYDEIKNDPSFDGTYGVKSEKEMIAELSNPRFRQKLRAKNLLQRIVDAIKQLLGIDKGANAEDNLEGTLEYMIENFDQNAFDIVLKANENKDAYTLFSALPTKNDFEVEKKAMLGISMMHGFVPFDEMGKTFRTLINEREAMVQRLASKANKTAYDKERLARLEQDLEAAYRQLEWWENVQADLVPTDEVQPEVSKDMEPQSLEEYLSQFFTMSKTKTETKTITDENGKKKTIRLGGKRNGVMLTPETLTSEMGWKSGDWAGIKYIVSAKDGLSLDAIAEMIAEDEDAKQFLGNMDTMDIKNAVMDFLQSVGTYAEIRDYVKHQREAAAQEEVNFANAQIQYNAQRIEEETGMSVDEYNAMVIEDAFKAAEENLTMLESSEINGNFENLTEEEYADHIESLVRAEEGRVYEGNEDFEGEQSGHVLPDNEWSSENDEERTGDDSQRGDSSSEGDRGGEAGGVGQPSIGHSKPGVVSDRLETEGLSVEEIVETGKQKVAAENADAADVFMQKLRKINEKLSGLRSALAAQREYDQNTVKILTSLANDLLEGGKLTDMTRGEIKRLLSVIKDATGKSDLSVSVDRLMDIMIANQLRFAKNRFADLLKIKASKVNASGVEAQGKLDVQGQQIMQSLKDAMKASEEVLNDWIAEAENDLDSDSDAVRHNAELKLAGYELARQYKEDIEASETEEAALREDLKKTEHEGKLTKEQLKEYRKTIYDAVRENKMARVNSYEAMLESLSSMLAGSVARAVAFREAETQRVENIHHMANSDMQGMPADEHNKKDSWFWNSSLVRFLFKPLATFDQMLRAFAPKSRSGEGYLWNHFMGGWLKATENEYKGIQDAHDRLDAYVRYNFGIQRWSDLFALERKLPKAEVTWWNAGKMETFEVSQGNLLYIYMINKMADGRMKLRKMGITEDDVDNIIRSIDPRFLDLADWIQERFLPSLREKYNDVHERLFGAPMAAIDNYFPIRVLANARAREVDLGVDESNAKPSTITGNIIKRTKNSLALDILGSDAFDVVLGHIEEMEKWAAFAEWNKDLNTLLSYKKFRNRVQNMAGIYGAGNVVWNNFRSAAEIAAGVYKPATKNDSVDKAIMNIAKGVTGAKISFRVYTAFKQLLSWPAFLSDARTDILAKNMANPFGAWKWSMENLPLFEKRWKSRQAGDSRLMETESDWKIWKSKAVEIAGRLGMTPNAFVDAVTVAIGARSIYETRLKKYLDYGYSQEVAEEKAKRDATVLFNESQQSNESAFLSQIQVDRTVASVVFTVFRNSSMGYQRMYVDAIRNIGRMMKPGYKGESVEFMTKQMVRDGLTPEQAERAANRIYNRSFAKNAMQALTFGFIVQLAWNLGPYLPYIFGGDDDEKKEEMVKDAIVRALVGGPVEGLAGGNIISNAGGNLAMGESLSKVSGAQLPLASDIENTFRLFGNDNVRAYNDLFNLAVQSFVGVNPQTISDIVVAVVDACNGDLETSTEAMLCIMRILQVPQSQIENFYIDEIDFKADEAYDMTVKEFAERYAKYKVMRNAPIGKALNLYTDEKEKELEEKQIKTFTQKAKEERKRRGSEEAKAWYQYVEGSEYKEMDQTLKDIREQIEAEAHAGRFDSDIIRAAQQKMMDLQQTPAFQKYMDAKMIKSQTDKLKEAPDWVDVSELKKLRKEKFDKVFKESNSVE